MCLQEKQAPIAAYAISDAGSEVAIATSDGSVQILGLEDGRPARMLVAHDEVHCVSFSADTKRIAAACMGGKARVFDVESGRELASFDAYAGIDRTAYAFLSKDGTRLVTSGRSKDAMLWDVSENKRIRSLGDDTGIVEFADWSLDSSLVLTTSDGRCARLWDGRTGEPRSDAVRLPTAEVQGLSLSPDGWRLAVACTDARARVVDMRTGTVKITVSHADVDLLGDLEVEGVSFSHDGLHLLTTTQLGHEVRCWDSRDGRQEWSWASPRGGGKPGGWFSADYLPEDREVFVDSPPTWVDAKSGKTKRALAGTGKVEYFLSANGGYLSAIENDELILRDAANFEERYRISSTPGHPVTVLKVPAKSDSGR